MTTEDILLIIRFQQSDFLKFIKYTDDKNRNKEYRNDFKILTLIFLKTQMIKLHHNTSNKARQVIFNGFLVVSGDIFVRG